MVFLVFFGVPKNTSFNKKWCFFGVFWCVSSTCAVVRAARPRRIIMHSMQRVHLFLVDDAKAVAHEHAGTHNARETGDKRGDP